MSDVKINFGCGEKRKEGYINVDHGNMRFADMDIDLNAIDKFYWADNSVGLIEAFHISEHFDPDRLIWFYKEIHRILEPNGMFIVEMPNLDTWIEYYLQERVNYILESNRLISKKETLEDSDIKRYFYFTQMIFGYGSEGQYHRLGLNPLMLCVCLNMAGFTKVRIMQGKDYHADVSIKEHGDKFYNAQWLCMRAEAIK